MFGMLGKFRSIPGQRDALVALLLECTTDMPGCLSYVVALDPADADAIWVTEAWTDEGSHAASLAIPAVKQAIAKAMPLIAGVDLHQKTIPVGGYGLAG